MALIMALIMPLIMVLIMNPQQLCGLEGCDLTPTVISTLQCFYTGNILHNTSYNTSYQYMGFNQ